MKKRTTQILRLGQFVSVSTTVIFCWIVIPSACLGEPAYNGKPLSEWLLELKFKGMAHHWGAIPAQTQQPEDAVRQIGTNAIPTLLEILGATERTKGDVLEKLKSQKFREMFSREDPNLDDLADVAVQAFGLLGTNAVSAIPQINKLFYNAETSYAAASALAELGPKGLAALTNDMSDKTLAGVVVWTIGHKGGGDISTVTHLLISALQSSDGTARGNAARFLVGKDPSLTIPALIPLLDDVEYYPRESAAIALTSFGPAAKDAIPKLLSLYTNSWDLTYMQAINAIDKSVAMEAEQLMVNSGPLNKARSGYTQTKLASGLELIAGGYVHTEFPTVKNQYLASAELFDPKTGKWTETGEMTAKRCRHIATLLPNGQVLVAGGSDGKNDLSSAEIYDPISGRWTGTGSMNMAHYGDYAILQSSGKVLVFSGGFDGVKTFNDKLHQELYDPATGTWTAITNR